MTVYEFEGRRPTISASAFVHETAVLIGSVTLGENCLVSAGAVLRADWGELIIGDGSNIQENVVIHAGLGATMHLGPSSHIGHGAILHNCELEEHVVVGMGAIIQDHARIGEGALIGAGAVVAPRTEIPPRSLAVGIPAKVVKQLDEKMEEFTWHGTRIYQTLPGRCRDSLREIDIDECLQEPAGE